MTNQITQYIFILGMFTISCSNDKPDRKLDYWLNENSSIKQYPKDLSYLERETILSEKMDVLLKFVDTLENIKKQDSTLTKEKLDSIAKLLTMSLGGTKNNKPYLILDRKYISKEKIDHNNKLTYKALLESSWKHTVSFKDYQEYLLPYKLTNEIFDDWKDSLYLAHQKLIASRPTLKNLDSLYRFHISETYNSLSSKVSMRKLFPSEENYSWMDITKEGNCVSRCRYAIYHLRAAGVPATFDYIPNWGNRPYAKHAYVGLANKKIQVPNLLENSNDPKNLVDNLNAVSMEPEILQLFSKKKLPEGLYIQFEKTIPKVYRQTWTPQAEMNNILLNIPKEEVYRDLIKSNMIDVTAQYLKTANVETRKSLFESKSMAYLATFDTNGWTPVAFTPFSWYGKAIFKNVGKNVLYLPMTYNSNLIPYDNPFILEDSGKKKELICNKKRRISMKIKRKFPLFSYKHSVDLIGCRIEGANKSDFKDAILLYKVNNLTFNTKQLDFIKAVKLRYIRIVAPESKNLILSEIECYERKGLNYKKLEDINYKRGIPNGQDQNAFDGNLKTYFVGKYLACDFGTKVSVSQIRFTPMNDSNYVVPNYDYELFYWDSGWVSSGKKSAHSDYLIYNNIPSGTIYWLKCLTTGKEERIFTYENGIQKWW